MVTHNLDFSMFCADAVYTIEKICKTYGWKILENGNIELPESDLEILICLNSFLEIVFKGGLKHEVLVPRRRI